MDYNFQDYQDYTQIQEPLNNSDVSREPLEPKDLRAHARSDIEWGALTKVFLLFFAQFFGMSIVSALAVLLPKTAAIILFSILSIGIFVTSSMASAGIIKSFLNVRRNEKPGLFCAMDRFLSFLGLMTLIFLIAFGVMLAGTLLVFLLTFLGRIGAIIGILFYIATFVLLFWIMFRISQAPFFCVDGMGPVESIKESFGKMKGNIGRYVRTMLPMLGWALLLEVALYAVIGIPIAIIAVKKSISLLAVIGLIATIIAFCAATIAFSIYAYMVQAEFYDDLIGKSMNPLKEKTTKKPAIIVGSMLLGATILTGALSILPVFNLSFDNIDNPFAGIENLNTIETHNSVSWPNGDSVEVTSSDENVQVTQNGEDLLVTDGTNEMQGKVLRQSIDEFISVNKPNDTEFLADENAQTTIGENVRKALWENNGKYYYAMSLPLSEPTIVALMGSPSTDSLLKLLSAVHVDYKRNPAENIEYKLNLDNNTENNDTTESAENNSTNNAGSAQNLSKLLCVHPSKATQSQ